MSDRIVVTEDEIFIPSIGRIRKSDIRDAWVENRFPKARVMIDVMRSERAIWIRASSYAEAKEVVAVLGFEDFPGRRIEYAGPSRENRRGALALPPIVAFVVMVGIGGVSRWLAPFVALGVFFTVRIVLKALDPRITVDDDGVTFRSLLVRERLSFADVRAIEGRHFDDREEISFLLQSKGALRVLALPDHATYARALEHVERAFAAYRERVPPSNLELVLRRGGRTNERWLADLRTMRMGDRYRVAAVDEAELRALVADDAKPAHLRVAADIALKAEDDEPTESRLAQLATLDRGDA